MVSAAYAPHIVCSLAITSLGMHLLRQRKQGEADRARVGAQLSILEATLRRLRAGEHVSAREYERLRKLAFSPPDAGAQEREVIGWKEVLLGREVAPAAASAAAEWERRDLENVRREMESAA